MADKYSSQRDQILELALAGHTPRTLATRFGVTEWTIKRWVAHAHRRRELAYWKRTEVMPEQDIG